MLLMAHIGITLFGLIFTAVTYAYPNGQRIQISFVLLAATIASGSVLAIVSQGGLMRACVSGHLFSAVMYMGIYAAQSRLKSLSATNSN